MNEKMAICSRCIFDDTVPDITFDNQGVCNYCKMHEILDKKYPIESPAQEQTLNRVIERIKKRGRNVEYDCVVGVSGGRDSTYLLFLTVQLGLRPLAVHYDNGWNSETAVKNIENAVSKLNVDLYTVVEDWEEFKDLQVAFLKCSTPDAEIPTDIGLKRALYQAACSKKIKTVITGYSFRTEGISPLGWTYMEGKYVKSVQKEFGTRKLKKFRNLTLTHIIYYVFLKRIDTVHLLNYFPYKHQEIQQILAKQLSWKYYGGHHHENLYTKIFQSYYLPQKFNIDKRKTEYSALIRSGYLSRNEALEKMKKPYAYDPLLVEYTIKKLGISKSEFDKIMQEPPKSFQDYKTYYTLIRKLRLPIKMACKLDIFPEAFYQKYLG